MISSVTAEKTNEYADAATRAADSTIRSTKRKANDALDNLSERLQEAREQSNATLTRLSNEAENLARRGMGAVRENAAYVRDRATQVSDDTIGYVRDEPMRSLLIAAAAGAAVVALIALLSRAPRE